MENLNFSLNKDDVKSPTEAIERILRIFKILRKDCPWDKKQTIETLRILTLEEVYELSDAILKKDYEEIEKELGDILLHIIFYAEICSEEKKFDIVDVVNSICNKLINRHPHIFGDINVNSVEEVKQNWEKIKLTEGKKTSVLSGVPSGLPPIVKAYRIQEKASGIGFDWDNKAQVWEKVMEEIQEFREEEENYFNNGNEENFKKLQAEFGDIFFALINYARFLNINPDTALENTNQKFISRFNYLEKHTIAKGKSLHDMSLDEMNVFWEEAKKQK